MKNQVFKSVIAIFVAVVIVASVAVLMPKTSDAGESVTLPTIQVCSHVYIERVDAKYLKSERNFETGDVYYKSCRKCGKKNLNATFEANGPYIYGDADDDGVVDDKDMLLLIQYYANYEPELEESVVEVEPGADVNGDGVIDGADMGNLINYISNYDYETSSSTGTPTLTLTNASGKAAETVSVDFVLSNNPGIATLITTLSYDKDVLELVDIESSEFYVTSAKNVVLYDIFGANYTGNTTVCTLTFEIAEDAAAGDYEVEALFRSARSASTQSVGFTSIAGTVSVLPGEPEPSATFDEASVNIGDNLGLNVFATLKDIAEPKVRFTIGSGDMARTETVSPEDIGGGRIKATFDKITAERMADNILIEILDGEDVISSKNYSVKEYCKDLSELTADQLGISEEKYAALLELCANMLTYGAKAQTYAAYNTDSLADADSWVAEKVTAYTVTNSDNNKGVILARTGEDMIKSAYITLGKEVTLHFNVKAEDAEGVKLVVYYGDETPACKKEYALSNKITVGANEYYQIDCDGFAAGEYDKAISAYLVDAEGNVLHGISYSINSYAYSMWNSQDASLQPLVRALYSYGRSAKAYVAAQ